MGDVLTGVSVAAESLSLCVRAIVVLKRFYVTAKGARDELNHIVQLVGRTRNRIELMKVTLIELRKSPNGSNTAIAASFVSACDRLNETLEELVREASNVVEGDSRLGIARRLKWSMRESRVGEIIQRLEQQEKEVRDSYVLINSLTALRTQNELEKLTRSSDASSEITVGFSDITLNTPTSTTLGDDDAEEEKAFLSWKPPGARRASRSSQRTRHGSNGGTGLYVPRTWLGHVLTTNHSPEYLKLRHQLSDATFWGDWDTVFARLEDGYKLYGELWGNAPRMKDPSQANNISMWTPLHQAVYHHAPVDIVQRLLEYGALKTLRTRTSEFEHPNMSPLELAYDMEVTHLYPILSPVIKRPLPPETMQRLQYNFHRLIRSEVGVRVDSERLYLPVVEALTELDVGETVWFPVKFGNESAGYLFQLCGREIQVKSVNIQIPKEERLYRVMEDDIYETDQMINFAGDVEKDILGYYEQ